MTTPSGIPSVTDLMWSFIQNYLPLSVVTVMGGLLWRSSARVEAFQQKQQAHAEKLREHDIDIADLKKADAAARVIVAALPTKDDLRAQTIQLQSQMEHGFDNVIRLVSRRD